MRQAGSLHEREGINVSIFPVLSNEGKELVMVYCLFRISVILQLRYRMTLIRKVA